MKDLIIMMGDEQECVITGEVWENLTDLFHLRPFGIKSEIVVNLMLAGF